MKDERQKNRRGFSLVEVVMVAVIFSIIGIGIAGSFISGVKLWRRAQEMSGIYSELILTLEKVSRDVRQSVNVAVIGFEATTQESMGNKASEFSFPALVRDSVIRITYRFDPLEKKLFRGEVLLKDILSGSQKDRYSEKEVMKVDELKIDYYSYNTTTKTGGWQESWKKEDGIFRLVRLSGKYNGEEFTKIILVPIM